jgi:YVTN family beta-propeller protein
VSNYLGQSVTVVVHGDCVERPGSGLVPAPAGPYTIYLPVIGRDFVTQQRIVTIPVNGRPEGMAGLGNLLFVTLSSANRVAIINTETLTVVGEIAVPGDYPHTVVVAGGNAPGPVP